jgi:hypothetical protein
MEMRSLMVASLSKGGDSTCLVLCDSAFSSLWIDPLASPMMEAFSAMRIIPKNFILKSGICTNSDVRANKISVFRIEPERKKRSKMRFLQMKSR